MESDTVTILETPTKEKTVQYKGRFLYSKYNPSKAINEALSCMTILPGTLVLVFSPCLFYGWTSLLQKISSENGETDSFVLCVEPDECLYNLCTKTAGELGLFPNLLSNEYCSFEGIQKIIGAITSRSTSPLQGIALPAPGTIKRVLRIDLSAGVSFNQNFFETFFSSVQNAVAQFWKNRLTLVRLGRLYCKNIFQNLKAAEKSVDFFSLEKKVQKPILVFGAGESLNQGVLKASKDFFIIACDAAVSALLSRGVFPDAVVACESQLAIEKAYIGARNFYKGGTAEKKPILFLDLTSRPSIPRHTGFLPCFFYSEFEKNKFNARLTKSIKGIKAIPPLGSVGLVATQIALLLRRTSEVPVYVCGLDFSFSFGSTHARGTAQHKAQVLKAFRLLQAENYEASTSAGAEKILLGNGRSPAWFSTKNLLGYAALFGAYFSGTKNLFNISPSGLDLGIERLEPKWLEEPSNESTFCGGGLEDVHLKEDNEKKVSIKKFIESERAALKTLLDILSNGEGAKSRNKKMPLTEQIKGLLDEREYLFLHFPDGTEVRTSQDFLNRVKVQAEFFLKYIQS